MSGLEKSSDFISEDTPRGAEFKTTLTGRKRKWNWKRFGKLSAASANFFKKKIKKLSGLEKDYDFISEDTPCGAELTKKRRKIMLDFIWECIRQAIKNGDQR